MTNENRKAIVKWQMFDFFLFRNKFMDFFIGRSKLYIPLFKLKIAHFRPERHFTTNYKSIF